MIEFSSCRTDAIKEYYSTYDIHLKLMAFEHYLISDLLTFTALSFIAIGVTCEPTDEAYDSWVKGTVNAPGNSHLYRIVHRFSPTKGLTF